MKDRKYSRSASQLKKYLKCPAAYRYERFEKIPQPPAAWTARGIALHEAILQWESMDRDGSLPALAVEAYDLQIAELMEKEPDLGKWIRTPRTKNTENDIGYRKTDVKSQAEQYEARATDPECRWEIYKVNDETPAVELPVDIWLTKGDERLQVRGSIDAILRWKDTGALTLRDYKTGRPVNDEFDPRQLKVYKVGVQQSFGLDIKYGEYWFTKMDRPSKMYRFADDTEAELTSTFFSLDDMIDAGHFPTNPSKDNCEFCPFRKICPDGSMT